MLEKGQVAEGQGISCTRKEEDKSLLPVHFLLDREELLVHAVLSCRLHIACAALKAKASIL